MRKSNRPIWLSGVALGVILAATACTQNSEPAADTSAQSTESIAPVTVADYVNNFRLIDNSGFSHELFYYSDVPATVIVAEAAVAIAQVHPDPDFQPTLAKRLPPCPAG